MAQKQWGAESPSDGKVDQAVTKKSGSGNTSPIDPAAILPKKKTGQTKQGNKKATLSPVMQVMKAVTAAAINPKKKKAPKVPNGPSKANQSKPKNRIDKSDGPSAEGDGEA